MYESLLQAVTTEYTIKAIVQQSWILCEIAVYIYIYVLDMTCSCVTLT
jgi:hypothetical protein